MTAWTEARAYDPSLHLVDWNRIFNIASLGSFTIPLRDDPAERANILLAAAAVSDVTVAPDQVFSFNEVVGERTPDRGFQDGWMFDQGHLIRGTGGGICLVSTAIYNAALQAGMELIERHPHSGLVSYAPPGCDASVVYGVQDMRFRNTTALPITIKTEIADDSITVRLFGGTPPPGRKVYVKDTHFETLPPQVIEKPDATLAPGQIVVDQKPRAGFDVVVERFFTQHGRTVRREVVAQERREPRNKIVRVAAPPAVLPAPASDPAALPAPTTDPVTSLLLGGLPADQ
jgi:vancomycin resistance protein YoaR